VRIVAISLFLFSALLGQDFCYLVPPKKWDLADPKHYSPRVQIGFIGPTKKEFPSSVNLAVESVSIELPEYVAAVRKIHEADPNNRWRDLGPYQTSAGEGRLTEIEAKTEWGKVRLLQFILVKNRFAYIITASALKEEFPKFYTEFEKVFHSLTLTPDLIEPVPAGERKDSLRSRLACLKTEEWEPFQEHILKDYADMGAHWQVLVLRLAKEKMEIKS